MHKNNFGFLRLLFASLVIVSHSAEIVDGNRSRELLTSFAGTLTFGEIAVDAFFIISGYLVLKSFETSDSVRSYLGKRVRRIFPGFAVAYLFCVFVLGPWIDIDFRFHKISDYLRAGWEIITLSGPGWRGYPGLPVHAVNGSAWTIVYEFKCYLYIIALWAIGLYRRPWFFATLTFLLLISNEAHWPTWIGPLAKIVGHPSLFIRLAGLFCAGGCFYLFRDRIPFKPSLAGLATIALLACMYFSILAEMAFAIFGGYLIFYVALHFKSALLESINSRTDISYGVYLYAWPIQISLVYFLRIRSPVELMAMTLPLACLAGFLSWHLVERRFLRSAPDTSSQRAAAKLDIAT
jgi:peptidoglycan/LPS O-acetylase OafA/YrhL